MDADEGPLYSERPTTQVTVEVAAPAEQLWPLITDIGLPARFSTEFQGATWLDGDGLRLGARFAGRNAHAAIGEWQTTSTVIELQPGRQWAYAVGDPDQPSATWRWTLDPLPGGGTRLGLYARLGPGPSGLTPAIQAMPHKERRIVGRRLRDLHANMERTCQGLRALAERR